MSIVLAGDIDSKMNDLTIHRTTASLPFCGRYRFIDFTLSNLVNSNITTIGIVTKSNYSSLMDHIRMGRDWDLNRKNSGIAVFPPFVSNYSKNAYNGKIDALYAVLDYIKNAQEEYVVVTNSNIATNIDYEEIFKEHIKNNADITMITYKARTTNNSRVVVKTDNDNRVSSILIKNKASFELEDVCLYTYIIKKDLLIDIVEQSHEKGDQDFEKTILQPNVDKYRIFAFKHTGYSAIIDDIPSYYEESMRMLDASIRNDLFYRAGKIYTKTKDSVPTIYREKSSVKNSLIADGCDINGIVENSILFRGVVVEEGAVIRNSIVMENGHIMKNACMNYTITDKNVTICEDRTIGGYSTYPVVIVKNKIV